MLHRQIEADNQRSINFTNDKLGAHYERLSLFAVDRCCDCACDLAHFFHPRFSPESQRRGDRSFPSPRFWKIETKCNEVKRAATKRYEQEDRTKGGAR